MGIFQTHKFFHHSKEPDTFFKKMVRKRRRSLRSFQEHRTCIFADVINAPTTLVPMGVRCYGVRQKNNTKIKIQIPDKHQTRDLGRPWMPDICRTLALGTGHIPDIGPGYRTCTGHDVLKPLKNLRNPCFETLKSPTYHKVPEFCDFSEHPLFF